MALLRLASTRHSMTPHIIQRWRGGISSLAIYLIAWLMKSSPGRETCDGDQQI